MKNYKIHKALYLITLLLLPIACGKEYPFATEEDCDDCYTEKPEYGPLHIQLNSNVSDSGVIIKVIDGKFTEDLLNDDSRILYIDTTRELSLEVDVLLDKYYSVVAEYSINNKIFRVVDGDKIKLYSIKNTCDFDCWIIRGGDINCKFKF